VSAWAVEKRDRSARHLPAGQPARTAPEPAFGATNREPCRDADFASVPIRIGGGTDQVQRNVIGERVLGVPAEPRPDKSVPFRELGGAGA
jgi:hypothetical protein